MVVRKMSAGPLKPLATGLIAAAVAFTALAQGPADKARELFQTYVALGHAFDPALADLYADDAVIRNKRTLPSGEVRELKASGQNYKALIRKVMPAAKERGDRSTFSEVKYAPEGERVRITATRYSEMRKYSSPMSLLVGPGPDGRWQIHEEISESRPQ